MPPNESLIHKCTIVAVGALRSDGDKLQMSRGGKRGMLPEHICDGWVVAYTRLEFLVLKSVTFQSLSYWA